ncbi:MAG: hypothetical protein SLAVMIC_00175 [uncultured marine phage]|uniref:Uncharacterized protein n=1 Tax=uncultured marine phage TaxID=707152 RepID=A0A8D9CDN7_9VIRU|nr:MAG: hypothetical protein SLAVMIC_00175 [uncultured marine phage]
MEELTFFEHFDLIVSLLKFPLYIFTFIYMGITLKSKDELIKSKKLKNMIIISFTLSFLDLITLNGFGCSIWIFNAGLWLDSYYRIKSLI